MKKALAIIAATAIVIAASIEMPSAQMGGPGMMGGGQAPEEGYGYYGCPGPCGWGGYGMGPGMMGGGYGYGPGMMMGPGMMGMMHGWGGYGMGPGMMGGGYGYGPGMMMGPGMMWGYGEGYGPGSRKFLDETKELRRQLHTKMFDYMEALRDPNIKGEQLDKMREEIWNLKKQIFEKYGR